MNASTDRFTRTRPERGPALYYGYCNESGRYRMMDLPDYVTNVQQGVSQLMSDAQAAYEDVARGIYGQAPESTAGTTQQPHSHHARPHHHRHGRHHGHSHGCDCGCGSQHDCHCDCCVTDADVLVHGRCGEVRRIPVTFTNDTRRERPVTLELGPFVTSGGRNLQWPAELSTTSFTLRPCDEQTVVVAMAIRCAGADQVRPSPNDQPEPVNVRDSATLAAAGSAAAVAGRGGSVDRCEVGYATLRADGCLVRPIVIAVAVLPDDCDAYQRPCSCGCCH